MSAPVYLSPADDALLIRLTEYDFTPEQIAAHLGVPVGTIVNRSYKLRLREKVMTSQREAVLRLFADGVAISRSAARTGLLQTTISRILREARRIPPLPMDPEIEAIRASLVDVVSAPVSRVGKLDARRDEIEALIGQGVSEYLIAAKMGTDMVTLRRALGRMGLTGSREQAA